MSADEWLGVASALVLVAGGVIARPTTVAFCVPLMSIGAFGVGWFLGFALMGGPNLLGVLSGLGLGAVLGSHLLVWANMDMMDKQSYVRARAIKVGDTPTLAVPPETPSMLGVRSHPNRNAKWDDPLMPRSKLAGEAFGKMKERGISMPLFSLGSVLVSVALIGPIVLSHMWAAVAQLVVGGASLVAATVLRMRLRVVFGAVVGQADGKSVYQAFAPMRPWTGVVPPASAARWRYTEGSVEWVAFDGPIRGVHTIVLTGLPEGASIEAPRIAGTQFRQLLRTGQRATAQRRLPSSGPGAV